jgi:hypothetical protein
VVAVSARSDFAGADFMNWVKALLTNWTGQESRNSTSKSTIGAMVYLKDLLWSFSCIQAIPA